MIGVAEDNRSPPGARIGTGRRAGALNNGAVSIDICCGATALPIARALADGVDLQGWAGGNADAVEQCLERHGALLFRGFSVGEATLEGTVRRMSGALFEYLTDFQDERDHVDFCLISPELTRESRGLRIWLPLQLLGADAFREQLEEKLALARAGLRAMPGVEIVAAPELSIVAFRARYDGDRDALNQRWLERVNDRGRVLLSGTRLDGAFTLRMCVLCFRTHREHIDLALGDLADTLREIRDA